MYPAVKELLDYRSIQTKLVSGFRLLLQLPLEPDRNLKLFHPVLLCNICTLDAIVLMVIPSKQFNSVFCHIITSSILLTFHCFVKSTIIIINNNSPAEGKL